MEMLIPHYIFVKEILVRIVAAVCLLNLVSLIPQLIGLIGVGGLIPISITIKRLQKRCHQMRKRKQQLEDWFASNTVYYLMLKMVLYRFNTFDLNANMTEALYFDIAVALLAVLFPHSLFLWYLYWSLLGWKCLMADFMQFSFDNLLLESLAYAGLLSMLPDQFSTLLGLFQFRLLLVRTMLSHVHDYQPEHWTFRSLLKYKEVDRTSYLLTQPLPSHLAVCLYSYFPAELRAFNRLYYYVGMIVEVMMPWLVFVGSRTVNVCIAYCHAMQLIASRMIMGTYGWAPLLSLTLSLSLFEDHDLPWLVRSVMSVSLSSLLSSPFSLLLLKVHKSTTTAVLIYMVAIILAYTIGYCLHLIFFTIQVMALVYTVTSSDPAEEDQTEPRPEVPDVFNRWHERAVLLHYLARVFYCLGSDYSSLYPHRITDTGVRHELSITVSADKEVWHEVDFAFKPGSEYLPPKSVTSAGVSSSSVWEQWWCCWCCYYHMPRLDWSMWFLPFSSNKAAYPRWLWVLLISILEGNVSVLNLLHRNRSRVLGLLVNSASLDKKRHGEPLNLVEMRRKFWIRVCKKNYAKKVHWLLRDKQADIMTESNEDLIGAYWLTRVEDELLPPTQLDQLFHILDGYSTAAENRPLSPINLKYK